MAFAQSEAFRIFFKMFVGIIVIAIAHGIILTPALLGECPFIYSGIGHKEIQNAIDSTKEGDGDDQRVANHHTNLELSQQTVS